MIKIPIFNKITTRKKYANKRTSKKTLASQKEIKNKSSHSSIFNYSGLNDVLFKYNSNKSGNKYSADLDLNLTNDQIKIQKRTIGFLDKNSSLNKLKEMNNDMDLILTGIKTNLEGSTINSEKKIINADRFINQINENNKNVKVLYNNKNEEINKQYEHLKYSFSYMKICNFNFEIINKKKHLIDPDSLKEKFKVEYIFDNKLNNELIDIDNIIDLLYDYKKKIENLKLSNKSIISKNFINEDGINKELEKYIEMNKINENNKILHKEIEFLTEKLTFSFYKGELLLKKYYNKLKEKDVNIEKNIKEIANAYKTNIKNC